MKTYLILIGLTLVCCASAQIEMRPTCDDVSALPNRMTYSGFILFDEEQPIITNQHSLLITVAADSTGCLLHTSPSPRDQRGSRMPSSA